MATINRIVIGETQSHSKMLVTAHSDLLPLGSQRISFLKSHFKNLYKKMGNGQRPCAHREPQQLLWRALCSEGGWLSLATAQWACQGCQGLSFPSCTAGGWLSLCRRQPPDSPVTCPSPGGLAAQRP